MVDTLIEDYEKSDIVDERRELLIKNAAGQIYGGTSPNIVGYYLDSLLSNGSRRRNG